MLFYVHWHIPNATHVLFACSLACTDWHVPNTVHVEGRDSCKGAQSCGSSRGPCTVALWTPTIALSIALTSALSLAFPCPTQDANVLRLETEAAKSSIAKLKKVNTQLVAHKLRLESLLGQQNCEWAALQAVSSCHAMQPTHRMWAALQAVSSWRMTMIKHKCAFSVLSHQHTASTLLRRAAAKLLNTSMFRWLLEARHRVLRMWVLGWISSRHLKSLNTQAVTVDSIQQRYQHLQAPEEPYPTPTPNTNPNPNPILLSGTGTCRPCGSSMGRAPTPRHPGPSPHSSNSPSLSSRALALALVVAPDP